MNEAVVYYQIRLEDLIDNLADKVAAKIMPSKEKNIEQSKPITEKELCQFLGISLPTAIKWRKKGKIPHMQIGSAIRYDKRKVMDALEM